MRCWDRLAPSLFVIDRDYDRIYASNARSRFAAYVAQHASLWGDEIGPEGW